MPIQEPKGLPGLRGWGQLSKEERDAFRAAHPKMDGMSWKQQSNAYANQMFVDRFGKDAYSQMSRQERDAAYRAAVIGDATKEAFQDDENYGEISMMTPDSQYELLQSDYKHNKDRLKELDDWDKEHGDTFRAATLLAGQAGLDIAKGRARNKATSIYNEIQNKDYQRKADSVVNDTQTIKGNIESQINSGKLSVDEFNQEFEKLFKGSNETIKSSLGEYTVSNPGVNHYRAFENSHELEDYGLQDKINDYAEYLAIQQKYGTGAAIQRMENKLQTHIAENQNVWDWVGSAAYGIATKAAANIANKGIGLYALKYAGNDAALANYLEGKKENGEDIAWYFNPKYWNGVDQFSSFDPNFISKVNNDYGGVSKYNFQTAPGEERNFSTAINEMLKMAGYMASDAFIAYLGGEALGALGEGAGGLGTAIQKAAPFAIGALNATGISEAYGIGAYDQTLQEANQRIDKRIDADTRAYLDGVLGEKSGLKFENGRLKGTTDTSKQIAELLNNYVAERSRQILEAYPEAKPENIDSEALYEEGMQRYSTILSQKYLQENGDKYASERQMAREAAALAYKMTASLEEIRMAAANVTYRKFLLGDAQRKMLNQNFPGLSNTDINGKIVMQGERAARWSPILKNIWGGGRDNYLDDVNVAFNKGFALSSFNDAVSKELDPERYAANAGLIASFLTNFAGGLEGAREAFTDPQSLFDGFVGAGGGAVTIAPRVGRIAMGKTGNRYDMTDVARQAALQRTALDDAAYSIDDYMASDQFQKDIADGKIRRKSFAERANDYIFNPLLQEYSEAMQREREYSYLVDTANKTIEENRDKIDQLVKFGSALNGVAVAQEGKSLADAKDAKAYEAFTLAVALEEIGNDAIFKNSQYIQQVRQQLKDFSEGKIDSDTIVQFLNQPENKTVKESDNAEQIAKERIQTNAKQLIAMQTAYNQAMENIKSSNEFKAIENTVGSDYVAKQLAFNKSMYENRVERLSQMNQELTGSTEVSEMSSLIALYGSEEGRQRYEDYQNETIEAHKNRIGRLEAQLKRIENNRKLNKEQKGIYLQAKNLEIQEERRRLKEEQDKLSDIKKAKNYDYSTVLSKAEILHLNPVERERMLLSRDNIQEDKSPAQYSKEQLKVIDELVSELTLKDPTLLDKVTDSRVLYERNKDLLVSNSIMRNNLTAAAQYYAYAKGNRGWGAMNVWQRKVQDYNDGLLNAIPDSDSEALLSQAKAYSSAMLDDYIERHPDRKAILEPISRLAKLKEDTHDTITSLFGEQTDKTKDYSKRIDTIYNSELVGNVQQAMSAFEDLVDSSEGEATADLNRVLDELKELNYQRDATKLAERKAREDKRAAEEAEKNAKDDGKTYGWNGFKVGDKVYSTSKKTNNVGTVTGFDERTGAMMVRWGSNKTVDVVKDKDGVSKEAPKTLFQKETPAPVENPAPEKKAEVAERTPDVVTVKPTAESPVALGNKADYTGVLIGNALYEYEASGLANEEWGMRTASRKAAYGSLKAYYEWEDATHTDVQAIIDNELQNILDEHPDTEVKFMTKKPADSSDAIGNVVFEVVEYTNDVARHHNEDLGGVFDSNGKKWLVIGTLGYNPSSDTMKASWQKVINTIKGERQPFFNANSAESYYVSDSFSTKVDAIYAGMIADSFGEGQRTTTTLKDLMKDKKSNPHGLNYDNSVFYIMYTKEDGRVVNGGNIKEGKTLYPPQDVDRNLGLAFIMVPASNGNYIPIAFEPVRLNEVNQESILMGLINDSIDKLTSPELSDRVEGKRELSEYIVLSEGKDDIVVEENTVTVKRTGEDGVVYSKTLSIDDPAFRGSLRDEIINVAAYRVNVSAKVLSDSGMLEIYDDAGVLATTAKKLGTVNASFNVLEMNDAGKPIEKNSVGNVQGIEISKPQGTKITYNGLDYMIDGTKVTDLNGNNVPYQLARQVRASNYIDSQGLVPEHTSNDGSLNYYRIAKNDGSTTIFTKDKNGIVKELTEKQITQYNQRLEKKRQQEALQKALEEGTPLPDSKPQEAKTLDLGFSREGIVEQAAEKVKEVNKPVEQPKQPEHKIDNGIATNPVQTTGSQEKSYNFTTEFRNTNSTTYKAVENLLKKNGLDPDEMTGKQKKQWLADHNISYETAVSEESFIEMLNNCK